MNGTHLIIIIIKKKERKELRKSCRWTDSVQRALLPSSTLATSPFGRWQVPTCGTHLDVCMQSTPSICFSITFQGSEPKNEEDPDLRWTTPLKRNEVSKTDC